MINKLLMHGYALIGLSLLAMFVYDDIAYKHAMFKVANAQAAAIVMLYQKMTGA